MFWIFCKKASNIYIRQEPFSWQRIKILIHVYRCSCLTHDELNILHCCFCDSLIIRLHNLRSGDSTTLEVERTMLYWLLIIKVCCFYLNRMSVICRCHRCGTCTCMLQLIFMILFFVYFLLPNHFATTQSFVNVWPISVVGSSITGEVSRSLLF